MIPNYALEQFYSALRQMACRNERLQRRLEYAYAELEPLIAADFPDDMGEKFRDLMSRLTREGSISKTTAAMSDHEAAAVASLLLNLFFSLEAVNKAEADAQVLKE